MYKLRYKGIFRRDLPEWTIPTYEEIVTVKNGIAIVEKESTVRALLIRGFELVTDSAGVTPSSSSSPSPEKEKSEEKEAKKDEKLEEDEELKKEVIRLFEKEGYSPTKIARELKVGRKRVQDIIEAYYNAR